MKTHKMQAIVSGGSIIALKFKGGVVIATDTMLCYGSTLKYKDKQRIQQIQPDIFVSATGQYSDFQEVTKVLRNKSKQCFLYDDGIRFSHKDYGAFLRNLQYYKRNKFNPNFGTFVLAGYRNGQGYINTIDMYGDDFQQDSALTGFGKYFGTAIINNRWNKDSSQDQTLNVIADAFKQLYLRDCKAHDVIDLVIIRQNGSQRRRAKINGQWNYHMYRTHANQVIRR